MLDLIILLALLAGGLWLVTNAFAHPRGVYLRSAAGAAITIAAAGAIWFAASPGISNEAGLGAFFLFCAVAILAVAAAILACSAASARYLWNALQRRSA